MSTIWHGLARVLRSAAAECEAIAAEETHDRIDWIDQSKSPLGPRRHCRVVKALVSAGQPGAAIVGRRRLLSPQGLAQALRSTSSHGANGSESDDEQDEVADLKRELQLVRGGGR